MKIKELFKIGDPVQWGGGLAFLDRNNCHVRNKKKNKDAIVLCLKRESDGQEGYAYLRVLDQFESMAEQLLKWVFINNDIMGLTLDQLENLNTNLEIENNRGRLMVKGY